MRSEQGLNPQQWGISWLRASTLNHSSIKKLQWLCKERTYLQVNMKLCYINIHKDHNAAFLDTTSRSQACFFFFSIYTNNSWTSLKASGQLWWSSSSSCFVSRGCLPYQSFTHYLTYDVWSVNLSHNGFPSRFNTFNFQPLIFWSSWTWPSWKRRWDYQSLLYSIFSHPNGQNLKSIKECFYKQISAI